MAIRTVFSMVEECARGERAGWYEFVRDYGEIAHKLIAHYFPTLRPEISERVLEVFQRARTDENGWFRRLHFANDREFLMAFRGLVIAAARLAARLPASEVSLDQTGEPLHGLTVVEQELFWMFLKGYDTSETAAILMNAESTATAVRETSAQLVSQLAGGTPVGDIFRALQERAEKAGTLECLSLKTINDIINGQISWQDRDRAERHIRECIHCLDQFTVFQEMIWYARHAQPLEDSEVVGYLQRLGMREQRIGVVARLFSRSA